MNHAPRPLVARLSLILFVMLVIVACNSDEATPEPQSAIESAVVATTAPPPTAAPVPTIAEAPPTTESAAPASPAEAPSTDAEPAAVASANQPVLSDLAPLPAQCGWGKVVVARNATVTRAQPAMEPGPLFATSGSFAEKPVDEPCDTTPGLGPFPVSAGGSLVARLTGSPPAPNKWSIYNSGVAMSIFYEPLLGEGQYGPGQKIVEFAIPAEKTEAEMGGSWSGPGRLSVSIGAPGGSGPLTGSCFEQAYTAMAEVIEVPDSSPLQPGMTLHNGDRITTENVWGEVLIAGTSNWIAPGSEVEFNLFGPQVPIREGTGDLTTGQGPAYGNDVDEKLAGVLEGFRKAGYVMPDDIVMQDYHTATLEAAYQRISDIEDPCRAALDLKLYLDAQQWELSPTKVANLTGDIAAIWLLPNNWEVMDGWGKYLFGQLPGVRHIATAQNVLDTWDRVKKEWTPTIAKNKGAWTLNAYEAYKAQDWSEAQIEEQQRQRLQQSEDKLAEVKRLRENFEAVVPPLMAATEAEVAEIRADADTKLAKIDAETQPAFEALKQQLDAMPDEGPDAPQIAGRKSLKQIREDEFWEEWRRKRVVIELARDAAITEVEAPFYLQMQGLANEYERAVTEQMTDIARLQVERDALETYAKPMARKDCPGLKPPKAQLAPSVCIGPKVVEIGLKRGAAHVIKKKVGPGAEAVFKTITVNLDRIKRWIWPEGTDYSVEIQGETALVQVYEGQVVITSEDGPTVIVAADQQATLPAGEIATLAPEPERRLNGILLADLRLDSDVPEPADVSELRATDGNLPPDWAWQEPDKDQAGAGDAMLEVVDAGTLRITVPNENDFWGYRADAPRLLHKVTGDFDLEAEMLLESEGAHFALSEFLLFTPDIPLGYLRGQMNAGGLGEHYTIVGGGWAHWNGANKLGGLNREWDAAADAPMEPGQAVRVRLSRRGDQLKSYWSKDDGATWTLSGRQVIPELDTLWAGWVFKRMALDGLNDAPSVVTLRDVKLTTAPAGDLPETEWDIVDDAGMAVASGAEIIMTQHGSESRATQVYSPIPITGDFDLIVRFDAPPAEMGPEQERYIHVAATSNDGKNHAYIRNALAPDSHRYDADMAINETWYRYRYEDTLESAGRMRLVRLDGQFVGYYWKDDDWVQLTDWQDTFADPVYLDFRYQWKTPNPTLNSVRFTIEHLETEDGVLIGSVASASAPAPTLPSAPPSSEGAPAETTTAIEPTPVADAAGDLPSTPEPAPVIAKATEACTIAADPQIAPHQDHTALGCPAAPAKSTWAAVQPFENGLMLWREDTSLIYTFYDAGGWASWSDVWNDGIRTPGRGTPPQGLQAPERGFGFIWATEPAVFRNLGWARWDESGLCAVVQEFEKGMMIVRSGVETCDGRLNPLDSNWFGSVAAYDNSGWR